MINRILDFVFPPKCPFCREILKTSFPVCGNCMKELPFIKGNICRFCARPLPPLSYDVCPSCRSQKIYFKHSFVPLLYKDNVRHALLSLKYHNHPSYARAFAVLISDRILSSPFYTDFDYITFVPQSKHSEFSRGYNQAELLAKELSRILGIPYIKTLYRSNDGVNQAMLKTSSERKANVKKCYFPAEGSFSGKVLLTDDIYTTGSTANYNSKLLLKMGFEEVYLAVAAIND